MTLNVGCLREFEWEPPHNLSHDPDGAVHAWRDRLCCASVMHLCAEIPSASSLH